MTRLNSKLLLPVAALAGAFLLGHGAQSGAGAADLKLATWMSPKHPLNSKVFPKLIKDAAAVTGGTLKIKLFPSGQLGKGGPPQWKRAIERVADITFGVQGYTATIFPRSMIVSLPGVGKSSPEVTEKAWKIYAKYLASEYKKVKLLGIWFNWPAVLISRNKKISSLADIKGMKIRAPSSKDIPQINSWGAVGVFMGVSKIYNALTTGVLDGVYISPGALYRPWRLAEPGKYVIAGMNSPTSMFFTVMNRKSWDGLSADHRAKLEAVTGREFSLFAARTWGAVDKGQLETARTQGKGVEYSELSKAARAAFDKATARAVRAHLAEKEKKGIPARAIYAAVTR